MLSSIFVLQNLDLAKSIPRWLVIDQQGVIQYSGELIPIYRVFFALDDDTFQVLLAKFGRQVNTWEVPN